ncbi:MAG: hypothetical protein R8N23_19845 [Reichenbachiella sp.]|nr:hypothetical protein [Reichenbachiella sp.]MDW3212132.1 hypothetical protein [Reichenbachiella sp.]
MKISTLYLLTIAFLISCNQKESNSPGSEEVISIVEKAINDRQLINLNP